ncbi:hypothetical protein ACFTXB_28060 [Streptomyces sp. NPDC057074]|uniref:hypothetical protein n=1 Tax=Streptomyces sp. NPDC057074 TaxID=3346015 RepID=UPI00363C8ABA
MRVALGYEAGDGRDEDAAGPAAGTAAALVRTTTILRGCEVVDGHRATGVRRVSRDAGAAVGGQSVIRVVGTFACAGRAGPGPGPADLQRRRRRRPEEAGAGAGPVDAVHQIGGAVVLSLLTAVAATAATGHTAADIAARSGAAPTGSAVLLALTLALTTVLTLIVPARATRDERTL